MTDRPQAPQWVYDKHVDDVSYLNFIPRIEEHVVPAVGFAVSSFSETDPNSRYDVTVTKARYIDETDEAYGYPDPVQRATEIQLGSYVELNAALMDCYAFMLQHGCSGVVSDQPLPTALMHAGDVADEFGDYPVDAYQAALDNVS
jgi:hypothetical protein